MPAGNQSLQSFQATVNTTDLGSTYKAKLDADTSILGNPGGAFYVYPGGALNVNIDSQGFNYRQSGQTSPVLLGGTGGQTVVSLTAPGSNSYYACIYWNPTTSAAGVVYGPTAVSPKQVLPDDSAFFPLAFVLLTNGQATVLASNISDVRSVIPFVPVRYRNAALGANQSIECNGALNVSIDVTISASLTLTLNDLQVGIPVQIAVTSSAASLTLKLAATTPGGVAYSILGKNAAAATGFNFDFVATGYAMGASGNAIISNSIVGYRGTTPTLLFGVD